MKKKLPYPKTAEEKIQRRIAVAKRSGRLDLASEAVKRAFFESDVNSMSDVSSTGASQQLIDRIPPQEDGVFITTVEDNKENTSDKTIGTLTV